MSKCYLIPHKYFQLFTKTNGIELEWMDELELLYWNFDVPENFFKQNVAFPQQSVC